MPEAEQVPLRVRLGYSDVDTFVTRFAPNVSSGGVFIATKTPRPVDSTFRFEIALAGGPVVLAGEGKVSFVRDFNPEAPRELHGMGIQFISVDEHTRPMLDRLVEEREGAQRARRRSARPTRPRRPSISAFPAVALGEGGGANGSAAGVSPNGARGRVDIGDVDAGVSEESISRAMDYALELGAHDDVEALLGNTSRVPVTVDSIDDALDGLSRMLRPRSRSGLYRIAPPSTKNNGGGQD